MDNLRKINQILFFIFIVLAFFYLGSSFLIPFVFGVFLATLMTPFSNYIEKIWNSRIFSSLLGTLLVFLVVGGILFVFAYQISHFVSDFSNIRKEFESLVENLQNRISTATNLSPDDQNDIWQDRSENIINTIESGLTTFSGNILNTTASFFLVLVYVFLLLHYRDRFYDSIQMNVEEENKDEVKDVVLRIRKVVFHYLWGRAKVMAILGVMYYITFLIFGMPYALLLAIFGALITIIPFIGPLISGVIPILFSFIFLDNMQIAIFFSSIIIILQLVESYVLEPLIIGKEVKVNPLIVIIAIILGGAIWGLAGMILFVPIFAIIKIISNHIPGLRPVGYFFGNSKEAGKTPS